MITGLWWLTIALCLVFPFGHLTIARGIFAFPFSILDGLALVLFVWTALVYWRKRITLPGFTGFWLVFNLIAVVTLFLNPLHLPLRQLGTGGLYLVRFITDSGLLFTGFVLSMTGRQRQVRQWLLLAAVGTAVSGTVQYIIFPYLGPLLSSGWDPHLYRVVGSFLDPGFAGFIFLAGFLIAGDHYREIGLTKASRAGVLGFFYLNLLLTYSRATYFAFVVMLGYLAWKKSAYRWLVKFLLFFAISIILLPRIAGEGIRLERESTLKSRLENWSHALSIAQEHPFLGVGFDTYRYAQLAKGYPEAAAVNHAGAGSDSSLLLVLATTGAIGLAAFLIFIRELWRGYRENVRVSTGVKSLLLALFINSFFVNSVFYPWILIWVALYLGVAMAGKKPSAA
jgi:O-antigen ligase